MRGNGADLFITTLLYSTGGLFLHVYVCERRRFCSGSGGVRDGGSAMTSRPAVAVINTRSVATRAPDAEHRAFSAWCSAAASDEAQRAHVW